MFIWIQYLEYNPWMGDRKGTLLVKYTAPNYPKGSVMEGLLVNWWNLKPPAKQTSKMVIASTNAAIYNKATTPASTYPHQPSPCIILGAPSRRVVANPGCVCMRTFTASIGQRAISAKNSADALAARYSDVLHRYAFSYFATHHKRIKWGTRGLMRGLATVSRSI